MLNNGNIETLFGIFIFTASCCMAALTVFLVLEILK